MTDLRTQTVTRLLSEAAAGKPSAYDELFPLVYDQLRELASAFFRSQPGDHTLQPTALVHEAYLKLVDPPRAAAPRDRAHFLALAARVMRQILVDHARTKGRDKRGGGRTRISLDQTPSASTGNVVDLLAVDEALAKLERLSERKARLVELRFFGGLSNEEAAEVLDVSRTTVSEDWRLARAWLSRELRELAAP